MWKRQVRDVVLRAHVGNLRVSAVLTRDAVKEAARRWELPPAARATQLWGEYMAGTAMMSAFYKGDERVKVAVQSPAIQELFVESFAVGEVRGRVALSSPSVKSVDLYSASLDGSMHVSKILYGAAKPYETTIHATGIAEADFQTFYDVSEQVPTAVRISSDVKSDHVLCCGVTIQTMPPASIVTDDGHAPRTTYKLTDLDLDTQPLATRAIDSTTDLLAYINAVIPNASLTLADCRKVPLDFYCRCSKTSFAKRLQELGEPELRSVAATADDATGVDLTCHFCNETYAFPRDELTALANALATPQEQ